MLCNEQTNITMTLTATPIHAMQTTHITITLRTTPINVIQTANITIRREVAPINVIQPNKNDNNAYNNTNKCYATKSQRPSQRLQQQCWTLSNQETIIKTFAATQLDA